jgi:hypothetical protein
MLKASQKRIKRDDLSEESTLSIPAKNGLVGDNSNGSSTNAANAVIMFLRISVSLPEDFHHRQPGVESQHIKRFIRAIWKKVIQLFTLLIPDPS